MWAGGACRRRDGGPRSPAVDRRLPRSMEESRSRLSARSLDRPRGLLAVALLEPLDAARRVDQLLLPREEWVAVRADLNAKLFLGRLRREGMPAGAVDENLVVLRVDALLHAGVLSIRSLDLGTGYFILSWTARQWRVSSRPAAPPRSGHRPAP